MGLNNSYFHIPQLCLIRCLGLKVCYSLQTAIEMLPNDGVSEMVLLRKYYVQVLHDAGAFIKVRKRILMSSALHQDRLALANKSM